MLTPDEHKATDPADRERSGCGCVEQGAVVCAQACDCSCHSWVDPMDGYDEDGDE